MEITDLVLIFRKSLLELDFRVTIQLKHGANGQKFAQKTWLCIHEMHGIK